MALQGQRRRLPDGCAGTTRGGAAEMDRVNIARSKRGLHKPPLPTQRNSRAPHCEGANGAWLIRMRNTRMRCRNGKYGRRAGRNSGIRIFRKTLSHTVGPERRHRARPQPYSRLSFGAAKKRGSALAGVRTRWIHNQKNILRLLSTWKQKDC